MDLIDVKKLKFKHISNKLSCSQATRDFLNNFFFADEKEKYDPTNGLNEAQKDLEQVMEVCLK